jgi:flagellar protein FliO/FliZ
MAVELLKTVAALAAVLAVIFALAWLFRRLHLTPAQGDTGAEGWRLLGIRPLGPKRQIYVLEVGSHVLLIGATEKSLNTIMEISDPAECEKVTQALSRKKKAMTSFQDFLRRAESR